MEDMMNNFEGLEFADNRAPRCPISMVLDCSDSMTQVPPGENRSALEALNGGLDTLFAEIHKDDLSANRVELSFVPYGTHASDPTPFMTVSDENMFLPNLEPMGTTSTGEALMKALDSLEERKQTYRDNGITYYQPMMFLISDGLSMDSLDEARSRIQEMEDSKKLVFFPIGVQGAELEELSSLSSKRDALKLKGLSFVEMFQWISQSAASVSASQPGDKISAPAPTDWMEW